MITVRYGGVTIQFDSMRGAFDLVHRILHERWRDRVIMAFFASPVNRSRARIRSGNTKRKKYNERSTVN